MGATLNEHAVRRMWQQSDQPADLLFVLREIRYRDFGAHLRLKETLSPRKLRLFAAAAARLVFDDLPESSRQAIEVAEQFAEGLAYSRDLALARRAAMQNALGERWTVLRRIWNGEEWRWATWNRHLGIAAWATLAELTPETRVQWCDGPNPHDEVRILRDMFGDPFRLIPVDPSWRTSIVVRLAQSVYNDRAFRHLPILADALEEAGCTDADILNHFRQPGEHVRGCWALDLVLGKS